MNGRVLFLVFALLVSSTGTSWAAALSLGPDLGWSIRQIALIPKGSPQVDLVSHYVTLGGFVDYQVVPQWMVARVRGSLDIQDHMEYRGNPQPGTFSQHSMTAEGLVMTALPLAQRAGGVMSAWSREIPYIDLAESVPVVMVSDAKPGAIVGRYIVTSLEDRTLLGGTEGIWVVDRSTQPDSPRRWNKATLRVDLEDPQGFAFALRWLEMRPGGRKALRTVTKETGWSVRMRALAMSWAAGSVPDVYRLNLAKAMRTLKEESNE